MAAELKTFEGQSIFDLALQSYGSLDKVFKLIEENNLSNINDPVPAGLTLTFDKDLVGDLALFNTVRNRKLIYNTDEGFEDVEEPTPVPVEGIFDLSFDLTFN